MRGFKNLLGKAAGITVLIKMIKNDLKLCLMCFNYKNIKITKYFFIQNAKQFSSSNQALNLVNGFILNW